jgi:hypothetical protein
MAQATPSGGKTRSARWQVVRPEHELGSSAANSLGELPYEELLPEKTFGK